MSGEEKKFNLREIVLTAVITGVLTTVFSFLLMKSQLSEEHKYWEKRLKKERLVEMLDRQVVLYEEINKGILKAEIDVRQLKILASEFNVNMSMTKQYIKKPENINDDFKKNMIEYHKFIYAFSSKIQMIPIYFTERVDTLIKPMIKALEDNYNHTLKIGETVAIDSISEYLNKDYETIKSLTDYRLKLITAMNEDMVKTSKTLYEEE